MYPNAYKSSTQNFMKLGEDMCQVTLNMQRLMETGA